MAGFFGLFGGGNKQAPQSKEAYFLSEDEAKSFGDIDFMRKEVVIRRTFAKKKGAEEMESVKSISSSAKKEVEPATSPTTSFRAQSFFGSTSSQPSTPSTPAASAPAPSTPAPSAPAPSAPAPSTPAASTPQPRRTASDDMDMFRNMAKKIRK